MMKTAMLFWFRHCFILAVTLMQLPLFIIGAVAHGHYTGLKDPITDSPYCGGHDCNVIDSSWITAEANGLRLRMTLKQSQTVNRFSNVAIDAIVPWARVQDSPDGRWHACIADVDRNPPRGGIFCLFQFLSS